MAGSTGLLTAAEDCSPFLTLALVIAAGAIADRLGVFRLAAGVVLSEHVPTIVASAGVLTLTALLSGAINLDVAAVVAPPLAIRVATQRGSTRRDSWSQPLSPQTRHLSYCQRRTSQASSYWIDRQFLFPNISARAGLRGSS